MSRSSCQDIREEFHSYRLGELSPLGQKRMDAHLENCLACKTELWLQSRLEDTAKAGAFPLSDLKKRQLLTNIQQEISTHSNPILGSSFLQDLARPWLLAPTAVAVAALLYFAWPNQAPPTNASTAMVPVATAPQIEEEQPAEEIAKSELPRRKAGWLKAGFGVRAFAKNQSQLETKTSIKSSSIRLDSGEIIASFKRPEGVEPLKIQTPQATAIIRGTSFSVHTSGIETRVVVRNGKVEVRAHNGNTVMVHGGEMVLVTADGVNQSAAPSPHIEAITNQLGPQAGHALAVKPVAVKKETGRQLLMRARKTWRDGYPLKSLTLIEELLASESDQHLQEEGRYLKATVYRDQGQRRAASDTLGLLAEESNSFTGRLAQLERARILSHQLNQRDLALSTLKNLLEDNKRDVIAEDAWYELCAIHLETQNLVGAKRCLTEFVTEFPKSSHAEEAAQVLKKLH
jgi:hypothetical protein